MQKLMSSTLTDPVSLKQLKLPVRRDGYPRLQHPESATVLLNPACGEI